MTIYAAYRPRPGLKSSTESSSRALERAHSTTVRHVTWPTPWRWPANPTGTWSTPTTTCSGTPPQSPDRMSASWLRPTQTISPSLTIPCWWSRYSPRQCGSGPGPEAGVLRVGSGAGVLGLSLIHISEPTRLGMISYAVFCLKKNTGPEHIQDVRRLHDQSNLLYTSPSTHN